MLQIAHLFEYPQHTDRVAALIHAELRIDKDLHTPKSLAVLLRQAIAPDAIPLSRLALGARPA